MCHGAVGPFAESLRNLSLSVTCLPTFGPRKAFVNDTPFLAIYRGEISHSRPRHEQSESG
jgi:hypothetical protein